jgi:NADH:ubiquinone oxidoreductase subunit D
VIREDRLLLTELARLNTDVMPLAMRIMDESATAEEHYAFAERLAAMAQRLQDRGAHLGFVIDGEITAATDKHMSGGVRMLHHQDL